MGKSIDLASQKFGKLQVLCVDTNPSNKTKRWICRCDCGNITTAKTNELTSGHKTSCGCKKQNYFKKVHGQSGTRLHHIWKSIKMRCNNPDEPSYQHYGKRGITVCEEWENNFSTFYNWAIKNGYSDTLTIDRIDVNGNYEPGNCRWATIAEQSINKTNTVYIELNGILKPMKEWCNIYNVPYYLVQQRYKKITKNNIPCDDLSILFSKETLHLKKNRKPYVRKHFFDYRERPIIQYDANNIFIKEWSGIKEIKQTGLFNKNAVLNCCYGFAKTHKGFMWRYKDDNYPQYKSGK